MDKITDIVLNWDGRSLRAIEVDKVANGWTVKVLLNAYVPKDTSCLPYMYEYVFATGADVVVFMDLCMCKDKAESA